MDELCEVIRVVMRAVIICLYPVSTHTLFNEDVASTKIVQASFIRTTVKHEF